MTYKDANDCLMAGVSAEAMQACIAGARDFAPDKVKNAGEFEAELIDEWLNKHLDTGLLLPLDFPDFSIRPAELTIWPGIETEPLERTATGHMEPGYLLQSFLYSERIDSSNSGGSAVFSIRRERPTLTASAMRSGRSMTATSSKVFGSQIFT